MKLYFIRHGQSVANVLHIISDRDLPHPLTELGRQQAARAAEQLTSIPFARLFTSPVPRAVETAQIIGSALRLEPEITRALNEIDMGELDGKGDPEALQKHREIYNAWIDDHEYEKRSPGGESFLEVQERFIPFIKSLTVDSAQKNDTNFLMVSHGGILLSMLPILLDNISSEYAWSHRLANGGIVIAEAAKGKITCLKWENESFAQ